MSRSKALFHGQRAVESVRREGLWLEANVRNNLPLQRGSPEQFTYDEEHLRVKVLLIVPRSFKLISSTRATNLTPFPAGCVFWVALGERITY